MIAEADLKDLRRAHASLDKPIQRLVVVRLTVLIVLVFSFGRAFERLERELAALPGAPPAAEKSSSEDEPKEDSGPSRDAREDAYEKAFTAKLPIPELEVEIDLRYWIYGLPFCLIVSQLVLVQLARRRRLLAALAADRLAKVGEAATSLDRLTFDPDPRLRGFFAFPTGMLAVLESGAVAGLVIYIAVVGRPVWKVWTAGALVSAGLVLGTVLYAAIVLDVVARARQEGAIAKLLGTAARTPTLVRTWERARMFAAAGVRRARPGWSLGVGSLLMLSSLVLATSVDGCAKAYPGSALARGYATPSQAAASPGDVVDPPKEPANRQPVSWFGLTFDQHVLSRVVYLVGLLLAVAAPIALVLLWRRPRSRTIRRAVGVAARLSVLLWLWVVHDTFGSSFILPILLFAHGGDGDRVLLGTLAKQGDTLTLILLCILMALSFVTIASVYLLWAGEARTDRSKRWRQFRRAVEPLAVPALALGMGFVAITGIKVGLHGVPAHYVAVTLLAHGFTRLRAAPPT